VTTARTEAAPLSAEGAAPAAREIAPLSWGAIFDYVAPTFGLGCMFLLSAIYLLKFATDVLGMSAAVMGTILFFGRALWDAIADPIAGYLSDRTRTRFGRRRPWLLASVVPLSISFVLLWSPPRDAGPTFLVAWMAAMVVLFYTSSTANLIPHTALGAELTDGYHDRTRIFGGRHVMWTLGSFLAVAGLAALEAASDKRRTVFWIAVGAAACTALATLWTFARVRERPEFQGRGATRPYQALRDVMNNPHARLLLVVFGIESLGGATIAVLTQYVAEYVVKRPKVGAPAIAVYMLASILFVPLWLPLSRRFGKKALWLASMLLTAGSFGAMIFLTANAVPLLMVLAFLAGTAASCGAMMGPSIQADVIDWDEHATGERKEGSYFAAWNFVFKIANGLTIWLTGLVLSFSGYVPNVEQTERVKLVILALYGIFPMLCYGTGALLFARFRLDAAGYAEIRSALDARKR
jgi:Na+/melibiose symporter-like transporter